MKLSPDDYDVVVTARIIIDDAYRSPAGSTRLSSTRSAS
jgi:hypothetical protein